MALVGRWNLSHALQNVTMLALALQDSDSVYDVVRSVRQSNALSNSSLVDDVSAGRQSNALWNSSLVDDVYWVHVQKTGTSGTSSTRSQHDLPTFLLKYSRRRVVEPAENTTHGYWAGQGLAARKILQHEVREHATRRISPPVPETSWERHPIPLLHHAPGSDGAFEERVLVLQAAQPEHIVPYLRERLQNFQLPAEDDPWLSLPSNGPTQPTERPARPGEGHLPALFLREHRQVEREHLLVPQDVGRIDRAIRAAEQPKDHAESLERLEQLHVRGDRLPRQRNGDIRRSGPRGGLLGWSRKRCLPVGVRVRGVFGCCAAPSSFVVT